MQQPLRLRSRDEQRAAFSRMSYRDFCDKANKDMWKKLASESSVSCTSFVDFCRKTNKEFNSGYPNTMKDRLLSDKNMEMKHSVFGADRSYDRFWFEADGSRDGNKFSMDPRWVDEMFPREDLGIGGSDVPTITTVFSADGIDGYYFDVNGTPVLLKKDNMFI